MFDPGQPVDAPAQTGERQVPVSAIDAWAHDARLRALPARADVVVIGGGIVGCAAAYFLARRGVSVVVCEKGRIAGEQSGRNWGWVRRQGRDPRELPLMIESRRWWQDLATECLAHGDDLGFAIGPCLYVAGDAPALETFARWLDVARTHGLDTRILSAPELRSVLPHAHRSWVGALCTADEARAEPGRAVPAIARAAERAGARIVSACAVRGLERAAGRVQSVVTEHGAIQTSTVICAAGAWTRLFCRSLDIEIPQLRVLATVARTAPTRATFDGCAWAPGIAVRRRRDGGYTVAHAEAFTHALTPDSLRLARTFLPALRQEMGALRIRIDAEFWRALATPRKWPLDRPTPFERERVLAPAPEPAVLARIRSNLAASFPEIGAAPLVETWGGAIEVSPDVLPLIGPAAELPGFFIATGFSGHGFGIGPGAGRLLADLVMGTASAGGLAPFRLSRFADGSPIRPGPTL